MPRRSLGLRRRGEPTPQKGVGSLFGRDLRVFRGLRDVGDLWAGWAFMGNLGSDGRPWATLWRDFLVIFEK